MVFGQDKAAELSADMHLASGTRCPAGFDGDGTRPPIAFSDAFANSKSAKQESMSGQVVKSTSRARRPLCFTRCRPGETVSDKCQ